MKQFIRTTSTASLFSLLLAFGAARAGDIYRWVDDKGVTQIGDTVPEAYRSRAKVIGSTESPVDPQQQKDAEARAARDAALLKQIDASKSVSPPAPKPAAKQAAPAPASNDCAALYAAYRASQACFAPYVTVNGIRGGSQCTSVPDPSPRCGSPSVYPQ